MLIFHSRTLIPLWSTLASIRYSITHRQSTRLLFHPSILFRTTSYVKSISFYRSLRTSTWLDLFRIEVFCISLLQERVYAYIYTYTLHIPIIFYLSRNPDSNRGPIHYEWIALPTEPFRQFTTMISSNPTIVLLIGDKDRALFHIWK